jgi:hypothetical protein
MQSLKNATKTNMIQVVVIGMQSRTFGPYLTATSRTHHSCNGWPVEHAEPALLCILVFMV